MREVVGMRAVTSRTAPDETRQAFRYQLLKRHRATGPPELIGAVLRHLHTCYRNLGSIGMSIIYSEVYCIGM
jgi:hypothetical protein